MVRDTFLAPQKFGVKSFRDPTTRGATPYLRNINEWPISKKQYLKTNEINRIELIHHVQKYSLLKFNRYGPSIVGDGVPGVRIHPWHTWYLSVLGHHHTIEACKRGTKKCVTLWQNSQKWPKQPKWPFSVFYASRVTRLKNVHHCR